MDHSDVRIGQRVRTRPGAFPNGGMVGTVIRHDGSPTKRAPWIVQFKPGVEFFYGAEDLELVALAEK